MPYLSFYAYLHCTAHPIEAWPEVCYRSWSKGLGDLLMRTELAIGGPGLRGDGRMLSSCGLCFAAKPPVACMMAAAELRWAVSA